MLYVIYLSRSFICDSEWFYFKKQAPVAHDAVQMHLTTAGLKLESKQTFLRHNNHVAYRTILV